MAWLKSGDNAATYPLLMKLLVCRGADDRTLNEVAGWIWRLANESAGHMTDGYLEPGQAELLAPGRSKILIRQAVEVGLMSWEGRGRDRRLKLIDDEEFLHIRARAEIDWDRQRKRDNADPTLVVPVRVRDGDSCRYCGQIVYWNNRKGARGGTYDHREAGKQATSPETLVVACKSCNSSRGNDPAADERLPLRPAPAEPFYTEQTVRWLKGHGVDVVGSTKGDRAPAGASGPVQEHAGDGSGGPGQPWWEHAGDGSCGPATDEESGGRTPTGSRGPDVDAGVRAPEGSCGPGPSGGRTPTGSRGPDGVERVVAHDSASGPDLQIPADLSRSEVSGSGRVGSGRDGPDRVGLGRAGSGAAPAGGDPDLPSAVPRRSRRSRRGAGGGQC